MKERAKDAEPQEPGKLRSLSRALDILELLGRSGAEGLSVGAVACGIDVSRSTAFALLQTLVERGFVADARIGSGRQYRLGPVLLRLGDHVMASNPLSQVALPVLQQLTQSTGLTSRLAVLDDGYAVALARVDAPGPFRLSASLGRRELPHCSAVGKAIMSGMDERSAGALLQRLGMPRRTPRTLTSAQALMKELRIARERGYAFDDEEDMLGVFCIGAAVYDGAHEAVAAISVTGMRIEGSAASMPTLAAAVRASADRISVLLGGPRHEEWLAGHPPAVKAPKRS